MATTSQSQLIVCESHAHSSPSSQKRTKSHGYPSSSPPHHHLITAVLIAKLLSLRAIVDGTILSAILPRLSLGLRMTRFAFEDPMRYDPSRDPRLDPRHYGNSYTPEQLWDRLSQPSVLVSLSVILATILYQIAHSQAASRGRQVPTLGQIIWHSTVFIIPGFLLYAIDRWVNPPLFPRPMLQPQTTTHTAKAEVLNRLLRLDQTGGIVASVSKAGKRAYSSTFSGSKVDSGQPAGLQNWDYSCFQNSILQGLSSLKHLPRYLSGITLIQSASKSGEYTTASTLREFVAELNNPANNGKTLSTPSVLRNMNTMQQQDAQEYFFKLMDLVDKDIEKAAKAVYKPPGFEADVAKDDTVASQHSDDSGYQSLANLSKAGSDLISIRNPLEGLSAQRVACTACGYSEGLSMIPFNCLTLNFDIGVSHYDLFELLDNYVALESIQSVNCVKCTLLDYRNRIQQIVQRLPAAAERLEVVDRILEEDEFDDKSLKELKIADSNKISSTKTKQVVVGRPPPSLVMHMNRSVFDPTTFHSYKNMAAVQFPMTLDLGPWCIGSAGHGQDLEPMQTDTGAVKFRDVEADQEQWVTDPKASMVAGDTRQSKITGPIYELRAVVTHYGRHENGHYVCYRRHPGRAWKGVSGLAIGNEADLRHDPAAQDSMDDVCSTHGDQVTEETTSAADDGGKCDEQEESQWWRLSDETVYQVSEQDVLSQGGVYMLFYDCVDPNSVLVSGEKGAETEIYYNNLPISTEELASKLPSLSESSAMNHAYISSEQRSMVEDIYETSSLATSTTAFSDSQSEVTLAGTSSRASSVTLPAPDADASSSPLAGGVGKSTLSESLEPKDTNT